MKKPTQELARYVSSTKYEDLPREVTEYAKKSILDTIGITIAGSNAEGCKEVAELVKGNR